MSGEGFWGESDRFRDIANGTFILSVVFFGFSIYFSRLGLPYAFISSFCMSGSFLAFGFAAALKFFDPLTRRALDIAERRKWVGVEEQVLEFTQKTSRKLIIVLLFPYYTYVHSVVKAVPADAPDPAALFSWGVQDSPDSFKMATEVLQFTREYYNKLGLLEAPKMGAWVEEKGGLIHAGEFIERLIDAWRLYTNAPTPAPRVLSALTKARIEAITLQDYDWSTAELVRSGESQEAAKSLRSGSITRGVLQLIEATLNVYEASTKLLGDHALL